MSKKSKAALIIISAVVILGVGFSVSIPVVNDLHAKKVADELSALTLTEDTRIAEKTSAAGKLWGNGNGIQYTGYRKTRVRCAHGRGRAVNHGL